MPDSRAVHLALRAHALTLVVCTTGETTLGATADGYTRGTGSFIDDGFAAGMEITASGFPTTPTNGTAVVTRVSSKRLRVSRAIDATPTSSGRTITAALPSSWAWENLRFAPTEGVPWVEEHFVPGPSFLATLGPGGEIESRPMYVIRVHVAEGAGIGAPRRYADALLKHFPMRGVVTMGSGILRIRGDTGPFVGQLQRSQPGFIVVPVTIPLRLRATNTI